MANNEKYFYFIKRLDTNSETQTFVTAYWIRNYVSDVNEKIGDARRQLVGYLLEKDKGWIQKDKASHPGRKDSPRSIKPKKLIYDKPKSKPTLAARQSLDNVPTVFDLVRKGILSDLEKALNLTDVNATNSANETLLHVAATHGHLEIIDYLISKGAKLEVKDNKGRTPLHRAAEKGHDKAVNRLLQAGANIVASKDMDGCTPMHYAAISGNMEILEELLVAGNNKNINDKNIWRKTPLHLAAEHGHSNLIDFLLSNGSAINALDNNKDTPLHCACKAGHFDSVRALLNWSAPDKANLQAANSLKKTPLQAHRLYTPEYFIFSVNQ
uniref:Uncharacterized protein n=1 Tax=Naja naja TaxID=35670 RepID=A0A8C6XPG1_NAJNA